MQYFSSGSTGLYMHDKNYTCHEAIRSLSAGYIRKNLFGWWKIWVGSSLFALDFPPNSSLNLWASSAIPPQSVPSCAWFTQAMLS